MVEAVGKENIYHRDTEAQRKSGQRQSRPRMYADDTDKTLANIGLKVKRPTCEPKIANGRQLWATLYNRVGVVKGHV